MTTRTLSERCRELNEAAQRVADGVGLGPYDALNSIVRAYRLLPACTCDHHDQARLYRFQDGTLVNLWIDAPGSHIGSGGKGFDDQTELHDDCRI